MLSIKAFDDERYFKAYDVLVGDCLPYRHLLETVLTELNIKPNEKVLDAGCGTGNFLELLQKLGVQKVFAIDNSSYALKICKQKVFNVQLLHQDLRQPLPFSDNEFDKIATINVLYLVPEQHRKKILQELYRVLKPNGKIAIVNPKRGGKNIKIFGADIKEVFRRQGLLKALLRSLRSIKAFCLIASPYMRRVASQTFLTKEAQEKIIQEVGFQIVKSMYVYANQAILTIAYK